MRKMRIISAILLMGLGLSACGGNTAKPSSTTQTDPPATTSAQTTAAQTTAGTTAPQTDDVSVGEARAKGYIIATDYMPNDGSTDVAAEIQDLIFNNPNRTIYFPDGLYIIRRPIKTYAARELSVDIQLSNYAVIKASDKWDSEQAMFLLGSLEPSVHINDPGSNYSFTGGIIDGNGKAIGIAIEGSRETVIRGVSIKNVRIGIQVFQNYTGYASSDADISDVNITGNGTKESIGIQLFAYDNTVTNLRTSNVYTGVEIYSSGNMLRNVHPFYNLGEDNYAGSRAFVDYAGTNFYDYCYADNFSTGFYSEKGSNTYENCFNYWYADWAVEQVAFSFEGQFDSVIAYPHLGFNGRQADRVLLKVGAEGGTGVIITPIVDAELLTDFGFEEYLQGRVVTKK